MWLLECEGELFDSKPLSRPMYHLAHAPQTRESGYAREGTTSLAEQEQVLQLSQPSNVRCDPSPYLQRLERQEAKQTWAGSYLISDRTVSRKHLVVSVETPKPGDGVSLLQTNILIAADCAESRVHAKSKLTITDNSKTGTTLDGEKFYKESRVLDKTEHTVKLGSWAQPLK